MNRAIVGVTWIALLAALLPDMIRRELFDHAPSDALAVAIPGSVALVGFGSTLLFTA